MSDIRFGELNLAEWRGRWKSSPSDSDCTGEEYDRIESEFSKLLSRLGKAGSDEGCDFYSRGDFLGDRTLYLELVNHRVLEWELVGALESWLSRPDLRTWRVLIVTYAGDEATPVVYPGGVVLGPTIGSGAEGIESVRRILKMGTRFNARVLFVEWSAFQGVWTGDANARDVDWGDWIFEDWATIVEQNGLLGVWGASVAASDAYDQLRGALAPALCRAWDELLRPLFWKRRRELEDDWTDIVLVRIDPNTIEACLQTHLTLDPQELAPSFAEGTITDREAFMGRFEEFAAYLQCWVDLLNAAREEGAGIVMLVS